MEHSTAHFRKSLTRKTLRLSCNVSRPSARRFAQEESQGFERKLSAGIGKGLAFQIGEEIPLAHGVTPMLPKPRPFRLRHRIMAEANLARQSRSLEHT